MTRDELILKYLNYSDAVSARRFHGWQLKNGFDLWDVISVGREGLIEAAGKFEENRGAAFTTFAFIFIMGAIVEHIRDELGQKYHKPEMISYEDGILQEPFSMSRDGLEGRVCAKDALKKVLACLTLKQRVAMVLYDVHGMTCREIAGIEGCTKQAIQLRRVLARKRVRRLAPEVIGEWR